MTDGLPTEECYPYKSISGACVHQCKSIGERFKKYYCKKRSMEYLTTTESIKRSIYTYGPVQTFINIYADFYSYSTGTYELTTPNQFEGGHVVKIIGWGNDGTNDYWITQNQWGTSWGDNGFMNVKFGEVGVDYQAIGCEADW